MTALQQGILNAEILRNLGTLADNEDMLTRVARYLRKLVNELQHDPTLMTREEFFARVDEAEREIAEGKGKAFASVEELDQYIRSL